MSCFRYSSESGNGFSAQSAPVIESSPSAGQESSRRWALTSALISSTAVSSNSSMVDRIAGGVWSGINHPECIFPWKPDTNILVLLLWKDLQVSMYFSQSQQQCFDTPIVMWPIELAIMKARMVNSQWTDVMIVSWPSGSLYRCGNLMLNLSESVSSSSLQWVFRISSELFRTLAGLGTGGGIQK